MSAETAQWIVIAVGGVLTLIWYVGTRFAYARAAAGGTGGDDADPPLRDPDADDVARGEVVLAGEPEELSRRIAQHLAVGSNTAAQGTLRIAERTARGVRFESTAPSMRGGVVAPVTGSLRLHPEGDTVRVRYELDFAKWASFLRKVNFLVCFLYCGLFIVGTPLLIWFLVIPSENPAVRYQTFQIFQMVHGVWPPFLLGALWPRARRHAATTLRTSLENLR